MTTFTNFFRAATTCSSLGRVLELMGTEISQVAAGDRHTLALVPSRSKLYAFGVGGSGQLGRGPAATENALLPQMVQDSFASEPICLVAAGGNTSWAVTAAAYRYYMNF